MGFYGTQGACCLGCGMGLQMHSDSVWDTVLATLQALQSLSCPCFCLQQTALSGTMPQHAIEFRKQTKKVRGFAEMRSRFFGSQGRILRISIKAMGIVG